jgi:hypothetical protein
MDETPVNDATDDDPLAVEMSGVNAPAIVVVAHDRPNTLARLLGSLARMSVPSDASPELVISIDDSVRETMEIAQNFDWPFGAKQVLGRTSRMGLRAHVLACGDLTARYGSIVMLEDDLYVAPAAYGYARAAARFYEQADAVAGVSLYAYRLDEFFRLAFYPLDDGSDTFFMQLPSSWGQLWTATQWADFRAWERSPHSFDPDRLPRLAAEWPPRTSWKRLFLEYLIDTDRYFVFPRVSLTSNCGDAGEHFSRATINFTTPIVLGTRDWRFAPWNERAIRYDSWFEPTPETVSALWPDVARDELSIDLRCSKATRQLRTRWLLSSRACDEPLVSFPMLLLPEALNLDLPGQGSFFHLGRTSTFGELSGWRRRRMIEALNGEINRALARGILIDRVKRKLSRDTTDWRVT